MDIKKSAITILLGATFLALSLLTATAMMAITGFQWGVALIAFVWLLSGIGLIFLQNWARLLALLQTACIFLTQVYFLYRVRVFSFFHIAFAYFFIMTFVYLINPKTKEQFKKKK